MYTESLERKRSCLKSLPLTEVFDIDFPFSLPHFLTCRSISLLVNIGKVDRNLPHVSALSNWVSTGNGSFIFCNRRLEILVADMIFDEIFTARSLVCLCLIASGLVFTNGKRLQDRSRESRINKADDKSDLSNYRPISVLACFWNILERIMYNRFYQYLTENIILYSKQFGLQTEHTTEHAIVQLVERLECLKFLGILIDENLCCKECLKYIVKVNLLKVSSSSIRQSPI